MRTLWAAVALILLTAENAHAEPPSVARAEIVWAGLYEAEITGTISQPHTAVGRTNQLSNIRKLRATTTVEGRLGVSFGLEYKLWGKPGGASVPVTIVVILPKAGLRNPANPGPTFREHWRPSAQVIGGQTMVGYTLENDWEVVPGLWTFEIWSEDQKLGEQAFCVVTERAPRPSDGKDDDPCRSTPTA